MHIQVLQAQINHHFLYNTLNVIKSLADIHNVPEIKTIAMCMSELLRYNLKKVPIVYLKEELLQIQRYMTIQNIRFPGKFSFDYDVPDEFLGLEIPASFCSLLWRMPLAMVFPKKKKTATSV